MNKAENQFNTENELLIIGNGFDLQCKLRTTYNDFFLDRFGIKLVASLLKVKSRENISLCLSKAKAEFKSVFKKKINKFPVEKYLKTDSNANGYAINYFTRTLKDEYLAPHLDTEHDNTLKEKTDEINKIKLTNWDVIFICAYVLIGENSDIEWNDIETMIYQVVTTILSSKENTFKEGYFDPNNDKSLQKRNKFINIIRYCFKESRKSSSSILDSLQEFEAHFGEYIRKEIDNNKKNYLQNAENLLYELSLSNSNFKVNLDVISFNYTIDRCTIEHFKKVNKLKNINFNSWTNIHGIAYWNNNNTRHYFNKMDHNRNGLSAPIFGIDGHDVLSNRKDKLLNLNDPRVIFTKSFRLVDNQINSMRDESHNLNKKMDRIIFYGHSLGHADYSYFETIFDMYDLFNSNVKLDFYYRQFQTKLKNRESERKSLKQIINLLTSYGETVPNKHGENIVNRLVLEQRLNLLPSPK